MADRYWVGGTANWDATAGTKWATTSGGTGGASVPTSADDVFFDANSGTGTVTIATGNTGAKSINCTGFTGTLTHTNGVGITVAGSVTLVAGMTFNSSNSAFTFSGTGTLTTAGKTFSSVTVDGSGITLTLGDALNITNGRNLTVNRGGFNTANYSITAGTMSIQTTNTRTVTLGSSNITLNFGFDAFPTNLTFNAGTSQINISNSAASLSGGGQTFYNVAFTNTTAGTRTITGINTFNNLSVTAPSSAGVTQVTFDSNQTINGTLSTNGTAGNQRVWFRSNTYGERRTLTVNSAPSLTDADFRDIIVNGTSAPISGTRIGNCGQCSGITFSTPKSVYWTATSNQNWTSNHWASSSGGTPNTDNFPLPQDTAVFDNSTSGGTVSVTAISPYMSGVDMSTRTTPITFDSDNANGVQCFGSFRAGSGTTFFNTRAITFAGQGTKVIASAGKTWTFGIIIDAYGGTVELADALNTGSQDMGITNGTFNTNNFSVTVGRQLSVSNLSIANLGTSTLTLSRGGTALVTASTATVTGTYQINCTGNGAVLNLNSVPIYNLAFTGNTASFRTIIGASSFNNLSVTASATGLTTLSIDSNITVNGTFTCAGSSATQRAFVISSSLGTTRTITANAISADDCDFRDITIAGAAAGASPTRAGDCGGNSGINFPAPKTVYWNLAGTNNWNATGWATSSGGTPAVNNFPLAQDTAVFDDAGAAGTVVISGGHNVGTINASSRTSAMTLTNSAVATFYGGYTLGSGVTVSGTNTLTFSGRGTQTFTSAGKTITFPITVDSFSGTFQLGDALTIDSARTLTLTSGTFDAVSYNVTTGLFNGSATNTRTLNMGSGLWTLSGTGTVWGLGTTINLTFLKGTADILLSDTSTTARTFSGGGLSYNKLTIGGATGTSTTNITQNNEFAELASTKTVAHTIALGTTTQTFGKWTVTGSAGNVVTLTGTGTTHELAGSATSGIDYLAMGSIGFADTSQAEFYAGANSTGTAGAPVFRTAPPTPRTLYWVGGTGNWSDTARWSLSSGGAGGQAIPTSLDNVIFDSASSATSYTATVNQRFRVNQLTFAAPASGSLTLAGSSTLYLHGNTTFPATNFVRSWNGAIVLTGSTTGKTFTTNGTTFSGSSFFVGGYGCGWTLGSALNISTSQLLINRGSFDSGNFNITAGFLTSNTNVTRSITLGSSTVVLSSSGTSIGFQNTVNLTFNAGTSQINCSGSGAGLQANQTFYNVSFTSTAVGTRTITGANTFNNLTLIVGGSTTGLSELSINANQTITGTFTCSGSSAINRGFVRSDTIGTTRTLTVGTLAANDCDFRDITIAGTAAGTAPTRAGDCGGNSGITFPAPKTVYRVGTNTNWATGTGWALTSGGTASVDNFPLAQDTTVIDQNTALTGTLSYNASFNIGSIDASNRTTGITLSYNNPNTIYGNYTLGSGVTITGTTEQTFSGRGTMTFTSAGKTITFPIVVDTPTGTFQLGDAFSSSNTITHTRGTLNAQSYNVTCPAFASSNSNTRTLSMGSGTWTLSGTGTVWDASTITGLTFNKGTANIALSDTSTTARTFNGGTLSYNKLTIGGTTGISTLTFGQNNTFTEIASIKTVAHTIALGTTTQRVANFTAAGTAGNLLTITGNTSNLIYTGSGTINTNYLNVQGRVYGPSGQTTGFWYAGTNSTNSGTLGWLFSAAPAPIASNSNFFLLFG